MRQLIAIVTGIWLVSSVQAAPNIVVILADDLGWNDVGYHGSEIATPNLDALARGGVVLEQFRAQPTCSPTRAALMTGKSPLRLGITRAIAKLQPAGLDAEEATLADHLRSAGYQTFLTGKWHLGFAQTQYHPNARGFDHFYGHVTGGIGYWDHVHGGGLDWQRNGETVRETGYSTHLLADEAVRLIEGRDAARPMFLYASFNAPHLPNEAPEDAIAAYAHLPDPLRRRHAAMVSEFDAAVGRIVEALRSENMLDDTLIWFMSDNGGLYPHEGLEAMADLSTTLTSWFGEPLPVTMLEFIRTNSLEGRADNGPLRRGKGSAYEGGTRVPSLLYWPGRLGPRRARDFVTVLDVAPTLLGAAGVTTGEAFDGADRWAVLEGREGGQPPDYIAVGTDGEAIYRWPWKLIATGDDTAELYDLASDPFEADDLAEAEPARVRELMAALADAPRGESIHVSLWSVFRDPDFFGLEEGGEEDRPPWSEVVRE